MRIALSCLSSSVGFTLCSSRRVWTSLQIHRSILLRLEDSSHVTGGGYNCFSTGFLVQEQWVDIFVGCVWVVKKTLAGCSNDTKQTWFFSRSDDLNLAFVFCWLMDNVWIFEMVPRTIVGPIRLWLVAANSTRSNFCNFWKRIACVIQKVWLVLVVAAIRTNTLWESVETIPLSRPSSNAYHHFFWITGANLTWHVWKMDRVVFQVQWDGWFLRTDMPIKLLPIFVKLWKIPEKSFALRKLMNTCFCTKTIFRIANWCLILLMGNTSNTAEKWPTEITIYQFLTRFFG